MEGTLLVHGHSIGPGRQSREHHAPAPLLQVHSRIVHQGRLVDGQVGAVQQAYGEGRVGTPYLPYQGVFVGVFVAVPLRRRHPPGDALGIELEARQLTGNGSSFTGAKRQLVAKAQAVIKHPHPKIECSGVILFSGELHQQLVVMVAHQATLAPGLLPLLVAGRTLCRDQGKPLVEGRRMAKHQAKGRVTHHLATAKLYPVARRTLLTPDAETYLPIR